MKSSYHYRILSADGKIKYAGMDERAESWLCLEDARQLVNYDKNEMIYEYNEDLERLYEVF